MFAQFSVALQQRYMSVSASSASVEFEGLSLVDEEIESKLQYRQLLQSKVEEPICEPSK